MSLRDLNDPEYLAALLAAASPAPEGEPGPAPPAYGSQDPALGLVAEDLVAAPDADPQHRLLRYLRREILPTTFCVGCGGGTVLNAFAHAVDEMALDPRAMVCVTGIGCASWIPSPYFHCDTLHTTHGRAVAFANGVKIRRPDLKVIVIAGDGDLAGIGGNHLIHAARRNIDITVFLVNNFIYGMTGGQVSPTTPFGVKTTTTPYRNVEQPFKIADVVAAAGGSYVARWTTFHAFPLMEAMQEAIATEGFSFIEIMSQCPVSYGKMTRMTDPVTMLEHFRDVSVPVDAARGMTEAELADRIVVGKLAERDQPELGACLRELGRERQAALLAELTEQAEQPEQPPPPTPAAGKERP
jgi:2-oxoglutarate ferredoxin oxidoreductase subunit beta